MKGDREAMTNTTYTVEKTYFRNDRRFRRTTTLVIRKGETVERFVLMGVVPKRAIIAQYEGRL